MSESDPFVVLDLPGWNNKARTITKQVCRHQEYEGERVIQSRYVDTRDMRARVRESDSKQVCRHQGYESESERE
jgi:hypothetical protein